MTNTDFSVYGMKLQPGGAKAGTNVFEFCGDEEIIGVGWGGIEDKEYESADEVHNAHQEKAERRAEQGKNTAEILADGRLNAPLRYILKKMEVSDFVWVNEKNQFALCRITSDWQLDNNLPADEAERYRDHDIRHFRYVDWVDIPYEFVPGYARRQFSGPFGTIKRMNDGITQDAKQVIKSLHSQDEFETDRTLDRKAIASKVEQTGTERIMRL